MARRLEFVRQIVGAWDGAEGIVGRMTPKMLRREETVCRTYERPAHHERGLSPAAVAAVIVVEYGRLSLGAVARALDRWEELASRGGMYRSGQSRAAFLSVAGRVRAGY
jgi:hypothetical protein